jgi:ribosomal protein S27AE
MIRENERICPKCQQAALLYYDSANRIIITEFGTKKNLSIKRMHCTNCGVYHRVLPENIFSYKHYSYDIILGVIAGITNCETFGYEDYPSEVTMARWIAQK